MPRKPTPAVPAPYKQANPTALNNELMSAPVAFTPPDMRRFTFLYLVSVHFANRAFEDQLYKALGLPDDHDTYAQRRYQMLVNRFIRELRAQLCIDIRKEINFRPEPGLCGKRFVRIADFGLLSKPRVLRYFAAHQEAFEEYIKYVPCF